MRFERGHVWVVVVDDGQLQTADDVMEVVYGRSDAGGTVLRMSQTFKQCQNLERQVSPLALLRERGQRNVLPMQLRPTANRCTCTELGLFSGTYHCRHAMIALS